MSNPLKSFTVIVKIGSIIFSLNTTFDFNIISLSFGIDVNIFPFVSKIPKSIKSACPFPYSIILGFIA